MCAIGDDTGAEPQRSWLVLLTAVELFQVNPAQRLPQCSVQTVV